MQGHASPRAAKLTERAPRTHVSGAHVLCTQGMFHDVASTREHPHAHPRGARMRREHPQPAVDALGAFGRPAPGGSTIADFTCGNIGFSGFSHLTYEHFGSLTGFSHLTYEHFGFSVPPEKLSNPGLGQTCSFLTSQKEQVHIIKNLNTHPNTSKHIKTPRNTPKTPLNPSNTSKLLRTLVNASTDH